LDFGFCPSLDILKNAVLQELNPFPSSGEGLEDTYSVGSMRKS
jgi:hypothetical protein